MLFIKYKHLFSKSPIGGVPCLIPEADQLMSWMPPPSTHQKWLDVGAGQGSHTLKMRSLGYNVVPMDLDNSQFPESRVVDMHQMLPFHDKRFDGIFCSGTFEHALAPYLVLSEFQRVLRNQGVILLNMPAADNVKMMALPEHFNSLSRLQLESLYCTKLGMKIVKYDVAQRDPVVGAHQNIMLVVTK